MFYKLEGCLYGLWKDLLLRLLSLPQHKSQAGTWQHVTASNLPVEREDAPAVIDAQQRIWIFGGLQYGGRYQDSGPQGRSIALCRMKNLSSSTSGRKNKTGNRHLCDFWDVIFRIQRHVLE